MATLIMRTDGSSMFGDGYRWGTFPSASAGWVISNEEFMKSTSSWLDFFKIRASWGQNGNNYIKYDRRYFYLAKIETSSNSGYKFGSDMATTTSGTPNVGAYPPQKTKEDTKWETSEQIDLGFDARFLGSRLGVNFDWYKKMTKDWLIEQERESQWGAASPYINGGDVENTGIEVAVTWNDKIGSDFNYNVGVNVAHNKNKVTRIDNLKKYIEPNNSPLLSQGTENYIRAEEGHPIGYFFGMSYSGIWQNQAQIDAANAASVAAHPELGDKFAGTWAGAVPGDCIWDDWNGDGKITYALGESCDRHEIGKPNPDITLGVNLGFNWKGFDFAVNGTGAFGMQIMRSYRSFGDAWYHQYDTTILNRWHGEGTSNEKPRISPTGHTNTIWNSTRYMEDADYFKIKTITLGYDFKKLWKTCPLQQLRFYVQAQNVYTFTKYTGLDPEVGSAGGSDSWVSGVDLGLYPPARTFTVGASIKF
jgi:TonB-linked SusC/RagA family outer membrane protein